MTKFPNARLVLVVTILVMFTIAWQNPGLSKEKVTIAVPVPARSPPRASGRGEAQGRYAIALCTLPSLAIRHG